MYPVVKIIALLWKILTNVIQFTTAPKIVLIPSDHINVPVMKGIFWYYGQRYLSWYNNFCT